MGINFNKNSFGRLTAQTARTTNANKTNAQNAPAKANNAQASNNANSLNSATLKSNQGTKFDSNNFGSINEKPEIYEAKKKGDKKADDKKEKKSWGECVVNQWEKHGGMETWNGKGAEEMALGVLLGAAIEWVASRF